MSNEKRITFDPFRLDLPNECLWEGSQAIKLRPKAFAVLDYLLGRPGQLVTKDELLQAVWPGTFVGDAVLKVTIRQICETFSAMTQRLHASLKPPIVEAIASSVRSQKRTCRRRRTIARTEAMMRFGFTAACCRFALRRFVGSRQSTVADARLAREDAWQENVR